MSKLDTIYYYEIFIDSKVYWFSTIGLLGIFAYLNIKVMGDIGFVVAAACIALAIYLLIYTLKNKRP